MNTAEYLIKRLEELGIKDFFGLPGDYNLNILYTIENNSNTNWIGCTNELNAGYAADGYARENGYGALVTTYGVGELSAVNAIAGSYAENIPVIHIVGTPNSKDITNKTLLHHNFQEPKPQAYINAYQNIIETAVFLNRDNAKIEIDRVLKAFVKEKKPVYLAIPMDIAEMEISDKISDYEWNSDNNTLEIVINKIIDRISMSSNPVILGDTLIKRFNAKEEYRAFVEKSNLPTTNFLMGTNLIDNDCENNLGTYFSEFLNPSAQKYLEKTDCLIAIGPIYSDLNAFGFNLPYKINSQIAIYGTYTYIDNIKYENIKMKDVISKLTEKIEPFNINIEKTIVEYKPTVTTNETINSEYLYARLQEFIKEDDVLIAETGIIPQGVSQIKFPKRAELVTQTLWGSIGWATPAAFGTCIASPSKRIILLTGEGSHQISAMEIGNMLRYGVKPVILVLNNNGYTIERVLSKDFDDKFNDIVQINYSKFVRTFEGDIWSTQVKTQDELDKALKVTQILNKLCYIEIITNSIDMPKLTEQLIYKFKKNQHAYNLNSHEISTTNLKLNTPKKEKFSFKTKTHESLKD